MAFDIAKEHLRKAGLEDRIYEFEVSSATVELAAQAVGCEPARIAKTLSFMAVQKAVLIVAAGDAKVDNHKYKEQFHTKAKMLSPDEVTELVGHSVGGVCPFGVKEGVAVYLDESLKRFDVVYPACDSSDYSRKNEFHGLCLNHDIRVNETDIICIEHTAYSNQAAADKGGQHLIFERIDSDCIGRILILPHCL